MSRIAAAEHSLPIDIHYNKLQHWLVDRRAIPSKYALHLSTARTLTRIALSQTPAALQSALSIPSLTPHQHLPSLTVHQIFQQLTATAPAHPARPPLPSAPPLDKDLLGRFKSPLLRAWYAAVSAFDHHATYLIDAAHHLTHNVNNEAPALKSSIARLSRTISESSRRESHLLRAASDARRRFQQTLQHHQLQDVSDHTQPDFHSQLAERVQHVLPARLRAAVDAARQPAFLRCVQYYRAFATYVRLDQQLCVAHLCPVIQRVVDHDIDALVALRNVRAVCDQHTDHPQPPSRLEPLPSERDVAVDWHIELDDSGVELADTPIHPADTGVQLAHSATEIDWSAAMGVLHTSASNPTTATATADEPGTSSEQPLAPTLADATFREQYMNELVELRAFLNQRRAEMTRIDNTDVALALQRQQNDAKNGVQMDIHTVDDMYHTVDRVIDAIHGEETRKMVALWSNDNLLARTARGVLEAKMRAERADGAIEVCRRQRAVAAVQLKEETRRLELLGEQTRVIKSHVESALSKLYAGRDVNIVGEINVLFPAKRS